MTQEKKVSKEFGWLCKTMLLRTMRVLKWGEDDEKSRLESIAVRGIDDLQEAYDARKEALYAAANGLAIAEQITKVINTWRKP